MIDLWAQQKRQLKKMISVVSTSRALNEGKTVMMVNPNYSLKLTPETNKTLIEWVKPKQLESRAVYLMDGE